MCSLICTFDEFSHNGSATVDGVSFKSSISDYSLLI